ncbi:hypothetical protein Tco_1494319 [Tanacetum coccineum]
MSNLKTPPGKTRLEKDWGFDVAVARPKQKGKCASLTAAYSFQTRGQKKVFVSSSKELKLPDGYDCSGSESTTEPSPQSSRRRAKDVARGHGGDGGGDDRKGTRKPNLGGRSVGMQHTRQETQNLGLKAITDKSGPVPIWFEFGDRETLMPLGEHAAHWANYLGELIRELPLHHPSWRQVPSEEKAGFMARIGTQFDMRPHMESDRWPVIYAAIQQHLQKIYNGKKATLKEKHWIANSDGTYNLERIRQSRPSHISEDELLRLQGLGSNTETGVPYTEDEIMAIVRGGKQRGHIPGVGRSDDKFSQMLSQLESQPEIGGGSRSGGCGDDEQGYDEDDGEDEEDEDDKLVILVNIDLYLADNASFMVTTRRNSDDDVPNFEAMITAAVANALPNLTAALRTQITNDIRNGAGSSGGGGGDAIP